MKKILVVLVALVLLCGCFTTAFAGSGKLSQLYDKVDKANEKIARYVAQAQKTKKNDVDKMLDQIDKEVAKVQKFAKDFDGIAFVACDMETVLVDGQYVEIDPLRVVNVGDEEK